LASFVGQAVIVGHNVRFDLAFLEKENCLSQNEAIDTFALASILMPHEGRYSLGQLVDSLGIQFENRHRALGDAIASKELFLALVARASQLSSETLRKINQAALGTQWPLSDVFREAERSAAYRAVGSSIRDQLGAKGTLRDTLLAARSPVGKPLIPVDRRTALDVAKLSSLLEKGGALAEGFRGFEYRPQQVEMLDAVADAFNHSRHLLVEAGTGTGKSIAYLLPAIYWSVQNGERVVISTNTINLQDQLCEKDIPDLRAVLPFDVRATVLKGRSNYLCMYRLERMQNRRNLSWDELNVLAKVLVWLPHTLTGDRAELFLPTRRERMVWAEIGSDSDTCSAERCIHRRRGACFFYLARQRAENAHLIIVNHALLLADVATENRVLPAYNYLIVDEAHHLENATTYQLGNHISAYRIHSLIQSVGTYDQRQPGYAEEVARLCEGRISSDLQSDLQDTMGVLQECGDRLADEAETMFDALKLFVAEHGGSRGQYDVQVRLSRAVRLEPGWEQIELIWDGLSELLRDAAREVEHVLDVLGDLAESKIPGYDGLVQDGLTLQRQLDTMRNELDAIVVDAAGDRIVWLETRRDSDQVELYSVPLRVGHLVQQHLLWTKEAAIFTSATLCTGGEFTFIKERLGAVDAEELAVGSPFDYAAQVLLCLPTDIPEPNEPYHQKTLSSALLHLAQATRGRMLVLFTSYSQLRATYGSIHRVLAEREITVYAQGQGASRNQLLDNFRHTERAVLLGTRSFWEGIDVPGEALSCLVIAKLPFAVPSDPVFAARAEDMDDPFLHYAVPDAILKFRQGFGRLIRTQTDRGVVVVMDRRIRTKRYGELFLQSLPTCTVLESPWAELPAHAARWIDEGIVPPRAVEPKEETDDDEPQYVSFDDLGVF
jgi:DNA polymerase-3 subunit epsilon/ATP-dependent DNA helicase DinG